MVNGWSTFQIVRFHKMFCLDKEKTTKNVGFQQSVICPIIGPASFALGFVTRPPAHCFLRFV